MLRAASLCLRAALVLVFALAVAGCSSSPAASTPAAEPTQDSGAPLERRIVAIGDTHGTLAATRAALKLAGAIDDQDRWIGGPELTVVQTGDEIDRGDEDREVLDLFDRLKREGSVIPLVGNHEILNAEGDYARYTTPAADAAFSDLGGRTAAFAPGGPYAKMLATRPVILSLEGNVFVHGGVLPKHVTYGVERINAETKTWLESGGQEPAFLTASDAPVWTRLYSQDPNAAACATLGDALTALGAKRMIVGHTVQDAGIVSACDGKVWLIDVGMVFGGKPEVLEILGDDARVLR
jgi:hypothetical protein